MLIVLTAIDAPYQDVSLLWAIDWFVDRCRTTNNMLGDCYGAAVVEALSKKELIAMDEENKRIALAEKNEEMEAAQKLIRDNFKIGNITTEKMVSTQSTPKFI